MAVALKHLPAIIAALASAAWFCSPPAFSAAEEQPPMRFERVRSADPLCEPNCPEWISAEGKIQPGTAAAFQRLIASLNGRRLPILVHSLGGYATEGIAMGRLIRAKRLVVVVARTQLAPCSPAGSKACGVPRGAADTHGAICASACVFVLAGGVERYGSGQSFIGVHQSLTIFAQTHDIKYYRILYRIVNGKRQEISRTQTGETRTQSSWKQAAAPATESSIATHFRDMGMSPELEQLAETAPPSGAHWLTIQEQLETGIVTSWANPGEPISGGIGLNGLMGTPAPSCKKQLFEAAGAWDFEKPVEGRKIGLAATFDYLRGGGVVEATLKLQASDKADPSIYPPDVRGRGFSIRIEPKGGGYRVLKSISDDPLRAIVPRADFCNLSAKGHLIIEPFDGPATHISEANAAANPHEPPIAIAASSIDGMADLLDEACGGP
jgi:hypothetical protein